MYARVVVYSHDEDKDKLEAKARAGVIPIVTNSPGVHLVRRHGPGHPSCVN